MKKVELPKVFNIGDKQYNFSEEIELFRPKNVSKSKWKRWVKQEWVRWSDSDMLKNMGLWFFVMRLAPNYDERLLLPEKKRQK